MSTDTLGEFESALAGQDVGCTHTEADGFADALADVVEPPAVGAPLDIDGVSLDGTGVVTSPTPRQLRDAETGVAQAGAGVAEYGTLVVQSDVGGTEPVSLFPPTHVAVLRASDVLPDVRAGLDWLAEEFAAGRDSAVLATGPSATADMGAPVLGAHGPKHVHVLLVTDR